MKIALSSPAGRRRGLSLTEMMIAMSIFSLLVLGLIGLHMFGLRQDQLVESKLGATDQSRRAFGMMLAEVRGAKIVRIGNGTENSFTAIAAGRPQQGTALQIHPSTDTNVFIRYYFDTDMDQLRRVTSDVQGDKLIAEHLDLTNNLCFWAEDFKGAVVTDLTHNFVVRTRLEFVQYQFPLTKVGPGYLYDYYKLDFRATRRLPD